MSLLLEALKKAELAKQNSLGSGAQSEDPPLEEIRFEEPAEPVVRRAPVKDFDMPESAPMAIPETPMVRAPEPVATPAPARPVRAAPPIEPESAPPAAQEPERAAARQVFEVKEVDYNPKRPFYIALGLLGACAVGYGIYLWWQLQPRTTVNPATIQNAPKSAPIAKSSLPPPPPDNAPPAEAVNQPAQTASAEAPVAADPTVPKSAPTAPTVAPVVKPGPTAAANAPAQRSESAPIARQGQANPVAKPPPVAAEQPASTPRAATPRPPRLPIKVTPPVFQANDVLESAYAAFQRGDIDRARNDYQQVLGKEPTNRDALLGLAAIDVRTRDYSTAELRYMKLLELDPRDTHAHAALIALQGTVDPVQSASRIKSMIAAQPDATHLYFTLGNQYAAQSRWAEAQDAYFKAFSSEPDNADYAFNLAVSLDHLRQRKPALDYYRKALALAGTRPVGFDRKQADLRARELER